MYRICLFILCLIAFKPAHSQDDSLVVLNKQKNLIDSIINHFNVIGISKAPVIGADSLMGKYTGYVFLNNANSKIVKIELDADSIELKTTLYCEANNIIKIKENNDVFYCLNNCYYLNNIRQSSSAVVKRLVRYEKTLDVFLILFSQ